jgi:mRNA-degrading endonuclease RelE of RelBE toxin-antitoxin system
MGRRSDHNSGPMYTIEIARAAQAELGTLRVFDRARILSYTPTVAARHRKMLRDLRPSWDHVPPLWQLRVGDYRVFYDTDEAGHVVYVRRVIHKGARTTGEIV